MSHGCPPRLRALLTLLALAPSALAAGPATQSAFDPERPRWVIVDLSASKLLMTARARVESRILPADRISAPLLGTPSGAPVMPGAEVLEMTYAASGFGRESLTTLLADPASGGALQRVQLDGGSRQRQRTYRFTDVGAYHYTRWPATSAEESLPAARWTKREEGMRPYGPGGVGQPVTEATALLWLAAAARLDVAGDRIEVLTFSRRHVNRVVVEVTGRRSVRVDFEELSPAGARQRSGKTDALVLRLRGAPLEPAPGEEDDFELLGLHGDLELLLDPRTRAPLELHGRVKIAGQVTVRLRRAVLR
jgi:hypothetical protein